jgi:hypothetical protein
MAGSPVQGFGWEADSFLAGSGREACPYADTPALAVFDLPNRNSMQAMMLPPRSPQQRDLSGDDQSQRRRLAIAKAISHSEGDQP